MKAIATHFTPAIPGTTSKRLQSFEHMGGIRRVRQYYGWRSIVPAHDITIDGIIIPCDYVHVPSMQAFRVTQTMSNDEIAFYRLQDATTVEKNPILILELTEADPFSEQPDLSSEELMKQIYSLDVLIAYRPIPVMKGRELKELADIVERSKVRKFRDSMNKLAI